MRASTPRKIEIAFRDLPLVDRHDHSCGVVDDVEVRQVGPEIWELAALLVGPGAWRRRRPRWLTSLLPDHPLVRIDASEVASATSVVRLLKGSAELGLAKTERAMLASWKGK